ncbi:hypothetical protein ACWDR0_32450 [Streptomyces sp. NPDC003691]
MLTRGRLLWSVGVLVLVVAGVLGVRLWNGEPYPGSDPERVAVELEQRAQELYEDAALPEGTRAESPGVRKGGCQYRGLRGILHLDDGRRPDVWHFWLDWSAPRTDAAAARAGQERIRARLERLGWENVRGIFGDMGFRYRDPASGEQVDASWYRATGTLLVRVASPCGEVPQRFRDGGWPARSWQPA